MKWNDEWTRGTFYGFATQYGPYDGAWLNNQITSADGSFGEVFKTRWDAGCASGTPSSGTTCIWGAFAVMMDQGHVDGVHEWYTKMVSGGFGS